MSNIVEKQKEKFLELYHNKYNDTQIAKELGVGRKSVGRYRQSLGLPTNADYLRQQENIILELHKQGKTDAEIAKVLGTQRASVSNYRLRHNIPKNTLCHLTDNEKILVQELQQHGFQPSEIAYYLHKDYVFISKYLNIPILEEIKVPEIIDFSDKEYAILVGILLGDGNISKKIGKSPTFTTSHSPKQKEYCFHILRELKNLHPKIYLAVGKTPDTRNNKTYDTYIVRLPSSVLYEKMYQDFYRDKVKIIPEEYFKYFTAESLAYLFMDDGCKVATSYHIATMCFKKEYLDKFRQMLLDKFNIDTTAESDGRIYIRTNSAKHFTELIKPYMPDSMLYKLQNYESL